MHLCVLLSLETESAITCNVSTQEPIRDPAPKPFLGYCHIRTLCLAHAAIIDSQKQASVQHHHTVCANRLCRADHPYIMESK